MKNLVKLIGIIALVAVIGFSTACDFGGSGDSNGNENGGNNGGGSTNPTITIKNNTGYTVDGWNGGLWIKPSITAQSWGNGYIGGYSDQLSDGESRKFSLSQPLSTQKVYDFRLNGGGFNFRKNNLTVSEGIILTFTTSDLEQ